MSMDLDKAITKASKDTSVVFKDKPLEVVKSFFSGRDVFVFLPTEYGKTLIFVMLPLV